MKKIAVVILTKNEEKNIVAVIENVRKITDEIIIIDSGSDDATVGLANLHGARVLYRKWDNDFSARYLPQGYLWDVAGSPCFFDSDDLMF